MKQAPKLPPDAYNSESLRARFPEVYRRFFSENEVVVSVPFTFALSFGIAKRIGGFTVIQRIPRRAYVGIQSHHRKDSITYGTALIFNQAECSFVKADYDLINYPKVTEFLLAYLREKIKTENTGGMDINFLLEIPQNTGFATELSTAVLVAINLFTGALTNQEITEIQELSAADIIKRTSAASRRYHELHRTAMRLKTNTFSGNIGGGHPAHALRGDSPYPFVYFTEERAGSVRVPVPGKAPQDVTENIHALDELHTWGFFLDEFAGPINKQFPADVTGIGIGGGIEPHIASRHIATTLVSDMDTLREEIVGHCQKYIPEKSDHLPRFLKSVSEPGFYWKQVADGQTIGNLFVIRALIRAYREPTSPALLHMFFDAVSAAIRSTAPFEESLPRVIEYISEEIKRTADKTGHRIGIRRMGWGRQEGDVLVFSPPRVFRRTILDVVRTLQKKYLPSVSIDYASWRDGWEKSGLRVEQSLAHGRRSPLVADDAQVVNIIESNGTMHRMLAGGGVEQIAQGFDLLIDHVEEKIFVGGKPCSSKELPTQKVTADILIALLDAPSGTLANKALPQSTYTKYRNELTGKVLTPLKKVMRARLKKAPLLTVHGTLYDFTVTLNARGFKIGILS